MSFLKPNYNKPGRGVEKDEPQGPAFVKFFKLYFRNFSKMIGYGTVYFLFMLPLICFAAYFITVRINPELIANYVEALQKAGIGEYVEAGKMVMNNSWLVFLLTPVFYVPRWLSIPLVILSSVCIGPLNCGVVYCMRNHAREDHAWFSDMFTRAWRNKWQGLAFGFIDQAICLSLLVYLFSPESMGLPQAVFFYCRILCIAIFVLYMVMRWYIYQMIVTFNLKFRALIKNSWMFVILGFWRNLATGLSSVAMLALFILFPLFYPAAMPFFLLIMMFLMWSLLIFLAVFGTYPVMHKYLVAPALEEQRKAEAKKGRAGQSAEQDETADGDAEADEQGVETDEPDGSAGDEKNGEDDSILDDDD